MHTLLRLFAAAAALGIVVSAAAHAQKCEAIYEGAGCEHLVCGCGPRPAPRREEEPVSRPVEPERSHNPYLPSATPSPDWSKIEIPDPVLPASPPTRSISPGVLDDLSCDAECRFQKALNQYSSGQTFGQDGGASAVSERCEADRQRAETEMRRINNSSGEGICAAGRASEQMWMIYKNFLMACPASDPAGNAMQAAIQEIQTAREVQSQSCN